MIIRGYRASTPATAARGRVRGQRRVVRQAGAVTNALCSCPVLGAQASRQGGVEKKDRCRRSLGQGLRRVVGDLVARARMAVPVRTRRPKPAGDGGARRRGCEITTRSSGLSLPPGSKAIDGHHLVDRGPVARAVGTARVEQRARGGVATMAHTWAARRLRQRAARRKRNDERNTAGRTAKTRRRADHGDRPFTKRNRRRRTAPPTIR